MNYHGNRGKKEPSFLAISTNLVESSLLVKLVERLACRNYDCDHRFEDVPEGSSAIETSSVEVFATGDMNLTNACDIVHQSFITSFLFTCIRTKGERYHLQWANSLS